LRETAEHESISESARVIWTLALGSKLLINVIYVRYVGIGLESLSTEPTTDEQHY